VALAILTAILLFVFHKYCKGRSNRRRRGKKSAAGNVVSLVSAARNKTQIWQAAGEKGTKPNEGKRQVLPHYAAKICLAIEEIRYQIQPFDLDIKNFEVINGNAWPLTMFCPTQIADFAGDYAGNVQFVIALRTGTGKARANSRVPTSGTNANHQNTFRQMDVRMENPPPRATNMPTRSVTAKATSPLLRYFVDVKANHWHPLDAGRGGRLGQSSPLKPTKLILVAMIFYNSENSTRDIRSFCRLLFCHSNVVKDTSSLLQ